MAKKNTYSYQAKADEKIAKASGHNLKISPKHSVEICRSIRNMYLEDAKAFLEDVIAKKAVVPFKRHNKKVGHRSDLKGWPSGRYPVKAAAAILKVLENAEANAENMELDVENLKLVHASANRGVIIRGWTPRAFGRASPSNTPTTHIQIVLGEA
ncbi:MAG: 50S ribosomal protein L22 [Methanosphaera sp.]|uniref:50S ribosomal protein L22 n=1 Tax=Methanosphaera sp. TaxID=2666342 RepID=UPI0025F5562F|nr:50S ribosomal protein L22 [Methanosphaera sp.]MCI5866637.1 50S ribosomal protein L22 [Methanosphaera sp.]MDD6535121.1 50S ribosomal protein L22 [Methanosphaera sp.]MDY3955931.1 50S ribosomal protein L22 [Methanosphaera sp.]